MTLLDSIGHLAILENLLHFDHWLFQKINQQWTNSFFDHILPFLREANIWVPFYLFLLVFAALNFGKKGWLWSFGLIMTGIISDLTSSHLVKNLVFRYRPCRNPFLEDQVRLLVKYCPKDSSFTSSHACNHFAAATFIFFTLRGTSGWWRLVFLWALAISYAQVYVGVHFPLDVAGGAFLGFVIGYATQFVFRKQVGNLIIV
jgi:membrane-associated phospholipid phosphatase